MQLYSRAFATFQEKIELFILILKLFKHCEQAFDLQCILLKLLLFLLIVAEGDVLLSISL